jgi:hypothetical protein
LPARVGELAKIEYSNLSLKVIKDLGQIAIQGPMLEEFRKSSFSLVTINEN